MYTKKINKESYENCGYTELYINYLKNNKKSTMTEQDVYKKFKKIYGNNSPYNLKILKENIKKIYDKREEEYNKNIEFLGSFATDDVKEKIKKSAIQKYPFENLFVYQY